MSSSRQVSANLVEIIALVLLPLAVLMVAYSTLVFVWRNSQIAMKQAAYIDDRRCAVLHCVAVVGGQRCQWRTCFCGRACPPALTRRLPALPSSTPRRGPLLLAGMVVSALTAIFLVSCVDLW